MINFMIRIISVLRLPILRDYMVRMNIIFYLETQHRIHTLH